MSLKAFHIVFILLSSAISLILAGWGIQGYRASGNGGQLVLGLVGVVSLVLLIPYFLWFLKKMRQLAFLGFLLLAGRADACPVCFGDPGSPLVKGTRLGILFLVGLVTLLLAGIAATALSWSRRGRESV